VTELSVTPSSGRKGAVKVFGTLTERKLRKKADGW
jgi:hypothetical protein